MHRLILLFDNLSISISPKKINIVFQFGWTCRCWRILRNLPHVQNISTCWIYLKHKHRVWTYHLWTMVRSGYQILGKALLYSQRIIIWEAWILLKYEGDYGTKTIVDGAKWQYKIWTSSTTQNYVTFRVALDWKSTFNDVLYVLV